MRKGILLALSSSFESDLGLAHIASIAHRLTLTTPLGLGTYHYLNNFVCENPLKFSHNQMYIPFDLRPQIKMEKTV
jgi:O-succinylbenzoate synthase